jgi:hypothetical protein
MLSYRMSSVIRGSEPLMFISIRDRTLNSSAEWGHSILTERTPATVLSFKRRIQQRAALAKGTLPQA